MKKNKLKILLELFIDYFKIGLFTFGGGLSMIPLISKTFVEKRKYIDDDELLSIVAIAEATPGVIAVNCATYIGYKVLGVIGSIVSTIAVALPSFIILTIISIFYETFINIEIIRFLFLGLQYGATYLILRAGFKLYKSYNKTWLGYILIFISFISLILIKIFSLNISTILIILLSGFIYLMYFMIKDRKKKDDTK